MKKVFLLILGIVGSTVSLHAQSTSEIKLLSIGDTVPDIEFNDLLNYKSSTAKLSDFKGKLVILDFWSTSCSVCIDYFPQMQSLEKEFRNDLQIILVDGQTKVWHDNPQKIETILRNLKNRSGITMQLPIVLNCEILDRYFPTRTDPHEVWIDNNGIVVAITGADEVTASNIGNIIEGKKITMRLKKDVFFDLNHHSLSELIYGSRSLPGRTVSSSVLFKGLIDGLGGGMGVRQQRGIQGDIYTGWYATNQSLLSLYQSAFDIRYPANRIIIDIRDSEAFRRVNYTDTSKYSLCYSYDITVPPTSLEGLKKDVRKDIERIFRTKVIYGKRNIKCLVLRATPRSVKSFAKGGVEKYVMERIDSPKYVRNMPVPALVENLNINYFEIPLINETGMEGNVDINMPNKLTQTSIVRALEEAGFEVDLSARILNVAVIEDL